jgi:hypothetical protein
VELDTLTDGKAREEPGRGLLESTYHKSAEEYPFNDMESSDGKSNKATRRRSLCETPKPSADSEESIGVRCAVKTLKDPRDLIAEVCACGALSA